MALDVELGPARSSEASTIALMSRDLVEDGLRWRWRADPVRRMIRDPGFEVVVARRGGEVIGFAVMQLGFEEAHIVLLAVTPSWRRAGLGRRLVAWIEEMAKNAGVFTLSLEVRSQNAGARRFYERLGFDTVTHVHGYYDGKESAVQMRRDLRQSKRIG